MSDEFDAFLDDLFMGCAFAAWIDQAVFEQDWPDEERTRVRAYRYFEEELARQHADLKAHKQTASAAA